MNQEPKVVGGLISESLRGLITRQVEDHALVIWYDPEKHYGNVAETLTLPKTSIAQYNGSCFQLRREIDPLLNDMQPPRLLVYVPMDQGETDHALAELEAAGVVVQPGQQPPSRNTRLSLVARNALRPLRGDANAAEIEKHVEAGKLSLADLDAISEKKDSGVLSLIFGTSNAQETALSLAWFNFSMFAGDKSWVAGWLGGWGRAGDSQRAPSAEASDLGASPFGRRPQPPRRPVRGGQRGGQLGQFMSSLF